MSDVKESRLLIVRNLERYRAEPQASQAIEFEVFAEVPLDGTLSWGPFTLTSWDASPLPEGTRRSYVLRLLDCLTPPPTAQVTQSSSSGAPATRAGFYHGISMPDEFCTLATVFMRRRVVLGPLMRIKDRAIRVSPRNRPRHSALLTGTSKLSGFTEGLELVEKLSAEHHQLFILACRMYQEALVLLDDKPDLAYLLLVSCIEVFVAKFYPKTTESDLPADIQAALATHPDTAMRDKLSKRLVESDHRISRGFLAFIQQHVSKTFWDESPKIRPEDGRVEENELATLVKRIYNQRSKTLHAAEPFPPNVLDPPDNEAEIDRRKEIRVGSRSWGEAQIIPYVRFFERLVNHVLLEFLRRTIGPTESAPAVSNA